MEYVPETKSLTKCYRGFTALAGLNMMIPKGSIYGFVGRNGAGKTTLIRLICGLQEPTAGSYTLCGIENEESPAGFYGVLSGRGIVPDIRMPERPVVRTCGRLTGTRCAGYLTIFSRTPRSTLTETFRCVCHPTEP